MIAKQDFIMANLGNFLGKSSVAELLDQKLQAKAVEAFSVLYDKVVEAAPESKILKVVK